MIKAAASSMFLFVVCAALGQTGSPVETAHPTPSVQSRPANPLLPVGVISIQHGCPVFFLHARQVSGAELDEAKNHRGSLPTQRLRLIWEGPTDGRIASARVAIVGYSGRARVMNVANGDFAMPSRSMNVRFLNVAGEDNAAFVYATGFTAVRGIDIQSISYADGTTETFPKPGSCRIVPDHLMRIGS